MDNAMDITVVSSQSVCSLRNPAEQVHCIAGWWATSSPGSDLHPRTAAGILRFLTAGAAPAGSIDLAVSSEMNRTSQIG
jgi:hypothetical protein